MVLESTLINADALRKVLNTGGKIPEIITISKTKC